MKTSLGIRAFGGMATRFNPGGYKPELAGVSLDPRFGKGGFSSPDDATRAEALRLTFEGIDLAAEVDARFIIDGVAAKIDDAELRKAQQNKDAVRAYELVYAALGACAGGVGTPAGTRHVVEADPTWDSGHTRARRRVCE